MRDERGVAKIILVLLGVSPNVIGILIALLIPEQVMAEIPWLVDLASSLSKVIPSIGEGINRSSIPNVVAATYSTGWLLLPLQTGYLIVVLCTQFDSQHMPRMAKINHQKWGRIGTVVRFFAAAAFFLVCEYFLAGKMTYFYLGIDPWNSRIGIALSGGLGFLLINLWIAGAMAILLQTSNSDWE